MFDIVIHEQDSKEVRLLSEILDQLRELNHLIRHPQRTFTVAVKFSGDHMANNALVLNVGQTDIGTITPFLADGVTPSGGTVSAVTVTFTDPSATFVVNPDNTITFTAVAPTASVAPVSGSVTCTVTDTDSAVSKETIDFTVLVNAPVPPAQLTESIAVVFGTPTP